eukprot:1160426-Pelagomonas_calceolata.AAC.1
MDALDALAHPISMHALDGKDSFAVQLHLVPAKYSVKVVNVLDNTGGFLAEPYPWMQMVPSAC